MISAILIKIANDDDPDPKVFIPRIHPKLNKELNGFTDLIKAYLKSLCDSLRITFLLADKYPGIELCLAADVIFSVTCTEDIKNTMIGGPPVVHLQGPVIKNWFRKDINMYPELLPDLLNNTALLCDDVGITDLSLESIRQSVYCETPSARDFRATEIFAKTLIDLV